MNASLMWDARYRLAVPLAPSEFRRARSDGASDFGPSRTSSRNRRASIPSACPMRVRGGNAPSTISRTSHLASSRAPRSVGDPRGSQPPPSKTRQAEKGLLTNCDSLRSKPRPHQRSRRLFCPYPHPGTASTGFDQNMGGPPRSES
jgi:hypothetical protein